MNAWQKEYERRLRRVAGVTDDSVEAYVDARAWVTGGCETCGDNLGVDITVWVGRSYREFDDMGDLMRALAEVPDED